MGDSKEKGKMPTPSYPFRIEFEITTVCNLNCIYCYAKPFTNKIPSLKDIKYLFGKTEIEAHPFEIVLVGGEPFVRKDIIDVLQYARDTFVSASIGISTNGTLLSRLTEKQLTKLKNISEGLPIIQVSLDSTDPSTNDLTRGLSRLTMKGIKTLDMYGIPFSVGIIPTIFNRESILGTVRLLLTESQSVRMINIETLQPTYTMNSKVFYNLRINSDQQRLLRRAINEEIQASGRRDVKVSAEYSIEDNVGCSNSLIDNYGLTTCTAGLFRAGVFVDGTVTPCLLVRNVNLGNLFDESWDVIWEKSRSRFFEITERAGQCTIENLLRKSAPKIKQKI
ncbi:MAG: radical SAM protein [Candidatus Marsarchaeota archaeon]|nr:radical SAM protein [Candidatus Marsarchaeota archaeon]